MIDAKAEESSAQLTLKILNKAEFDKQKEQPGSIAAEKDKTIPGLQYFYTNDKQEIVFCVNDFIESQKESILVDESLSIGMRDYVFPDVFPIAHQESGAFRLLTKQFHEFVKNSWDAVCQRTDKNTLSLDELLLTIKSTVSKEKATITVTDNGTGITSGLFQKNKHYIQNLSNIYPYQKVYVDKAPGVETPKKETSEDVEKNIYLTQTADGWHISGFVNNQLGKLHKVQEMVDPASELYQLLTEDGQKSEPTNELKLLEHYAFYLNMVPFIRGERQLAYSDFLAGDSKSISAKTTERLGGAGMGIAQGDHALKAMQGGVYLRSTEQGCQVTLVSTPKINRQEFEEVWQKANSLDSGVRTTGALRTPSKISVPPKITAEISPDRPVSTITMSGGTKISLPCLKLRASPSPSVRGLTFTVLDESESSPTSGPTAPEKKLEVGRPKSPSQATAESYFAMREALKNKSKRNQKAKEPLKENSAGKVDENPFALTPTDGDPFESISTQMASSFFVKPPALVKQLSFGNEGLGLSRPVSPME